jgi:hypothetical protein
VQLARSDLVGLDRVRLGMEGARVFDEAARDRGRQFYWLAGHVPDIGARAIEFSLFCYLFCALVSGSREASLAEPAGGRLSSGSAAPPWPVWEMVGPFGGVDDPRRVWGTFGGAAGRWRQ